MRRLGYMADTGISIEWADLILTAESEHRCQWPHFALEMHRLPGIEAPRL